MLTPVSLRVKPPLWRRKWVQVSFTVLVVFIVVLSSLTLSGYLYARKSLPDLEGEIAFPQLKKQVEVVRDERGVAKITAETIEDLFFVQGYVTAQDRLFQMDMTRRLAGGRLAEVVGEAALDSDRFFRTYGMHRTTDAALERLNVEARTVVESFAAGVNQYIEDALKEGTLPLEFKLLKYTPELWTPEDTQLVVKYMGYTLASNFRDELEHYEVVKELGEDAKFLLPEYDDTLFPTIYRSEEATPLSSRTIGQLKAFAPHPFNGSNNWVISGELTESGYPMIANDPHLGLDIPSVWYQTHLELKGDFQSVGVTVAGVPGVVLGHNEHMAWGVTSLSADTQDLFLEKVNPDQPLQYEYDGEWEEAQVVKEVIKVKDGETHIENVEITRNGPVLNKVIENGPYQAVSMRWAGYEPGVELNAMLEINRAQDVYEFSNALDGFVTPALNWVFADREGNIAYRGQGLIPIRGKGEGALPVPGWDPDYQWKGFVPDKELPQVINPERGYIITANNQPVDETYPHLINKKFYPYRAERLTEIVEDQLASGRPFSIEKMKEMQVDFLNTQARALLPQLVQGINASDDGDTLSSMEAKALKMMEEWDYVESPASPEALVWHFWYEELAPAIMKDALGFPYDDYLVLHRIITDPDNPQWRDLFDRQDTKERETFQDMARETFVQAVERAVEVQGNDPDKWAWGKWHKMTLKHPLSAVKPLNLLFDIGSWELGGSGATPGALGFDRDTGQVNHGGGWRFVGDLASMNAFYDILLPGQSGQLFSPFYRDQVKVWSEGDLKPMIWKKEEHDKAKTFRFRPQT